MERYSLYLLCAILLLAGCGKTKNEKADASEGRMQHRIEHNEVTVDTLQRRDFMRELISNGRLIAARRSSLSFPVAGTIAAINARNGSRVHTGEQIARLDTGEYALQVHRAQLALDKARLGFYDVLVGQGYQAGDTVSPPAEVVQLARIRSGYADAVASLLSARRNLEHCTLRAPFTGKVADVEQQVYEQSKGEFCTLLDDNRLNVRFTVLESEYGLLVPGQEISVNTFADLRKEVKGRITAINPSIDAHGQVQVDAEVSNDGTLADGMNVRVAVRQRVPGQLVVPKSAVVIRDNLEVLFRYKDGKAQWTYVRTSLANSREYVVEANLDRGAELSPGDMVIVSGNLNLADGSDVSLGGNQ